MPNRPHPKACWFRKGLDLEEDEEEGWPVEFWFYTQHPRFVFTCVCIYIYMYICVYLFNCSFTYLGLQVCLCIYEGSAHIRMYVCMYVCLYVSIYLYM